MLLRGSVTPWRNEKNLGFLKKYVCHFIIFLSPICFCCSDMWHCFSGTAQSRLWSWWISKGFEAVILQFPLRQNKWWLQVLWEQGLLSEIALLKVQIPMENFGLYSTDDLCVCSCEAGQWCGACGSLSGCACRIRLGSWSGVWCPLAAHKSSPLVRPPWLWHWANKLTGAVSVGS